MPDTNFTTFYVGDSVDHAGFGEVDDFRLYNTSLKFEEVKCLNDLCEAGV